MIFTNLSLIMNETEPKSKNTLNYYKAYYTLTWSTVLSLDIAEDAGFLSDKSIVLGETTKESMHVEIRLPASQQFGPRYQQSDRMDSFMAGFIECFKNMSETYTWSINYSYFPYNTALSFYVKLTHFSPAYPIRYRNSKQATC